ncbi:Alpha/Beta hydrolase fold [Phytophthora cactorum]|nr:Alpha/Beta hydrolase fold [Phytophthora cactorum]
MTEAQPENRATLDAKTKLGASGSSSKLRPTAKEFVFNKAAPVWTPSSVTSPPPALPPLPLPLLPPLPPRRASLSSRPSPSCRPVRYGAGFRAYVDEDTRCPVVENVETVKESEATTTTSETVSTPATSAASSSSSEPEVEELKEEVKAEASEREEKQKQDVDAEVAEEATEPETEEPEVVAEQAVIGERIIYTIKQLLEMEPEVELCVMPEHQTTKALSAPAPEVSGKGMRRNDSSRSLGRHGSSGNFSEGRGRRERGSGRGGRGGRGGGRGHHDTAPALEDCAPLDINEETRWKPSHAKSRLDEPVENAEASLKEAKSILNKLSIEKFDKLSDQLIEVAVRGLEVLKGVIEMVIAKAQMEWHFSTMYAELCAKIAQTAMPAITLEEGEVVTDTHKLFRKLLLQRCQKEFEAKPEIEGLESLPEDGQLFKQRMLSSRIMHECVGILFGDVSAPDEESLECLCNLLSTIGQALEGNAREKAELNHINGYYASIKKLSGESTLLCTRVRFMLQDLLELRKNRWVARRKETKAMTIAEVHAEVAREAKEKERSSTKSGGHARLQRSQSMNSTGSLARTTDDVAVAARAAASSTSSSTPSSAPTVDADGWETVTGGARPKGLKHRSNSDRFPAPTTGGLPRHPSGTRLSSSNTFASLSGKDAIRKERGRSNSSSSSSSRSSRGREDVGRPPTPSSTKSSNGRSAKPEKAVETETAPTLTAEAFEKKVKAILDEYVELEDLEEAYASFTELNAVNYYALIPNKVLNIGLEKGDKEREAIAASWLSALQDVLEFAEDIEIDIPKTLPYLSEMVAPSVVAGSVTIPQLVAMSEHLRYNGKAAKLIGATLAAVVSCEDEARCRTAGRGKRRLHGAAGRGERNEEAVQAFYKDYALGSSSSCLHDQRYTDGHFINARGQKLFYCAAFPPESVPLRGVALFLHGIGEHSLRFTHVYRHLCLNGYGVIAYDMLGHGQSECEKPGCVHTGPSSTSSWTTLTIIMGISFGALVALNMILSGKHHFSGCVVASPAIAVEYTLGLRIMETVSKPLVWMFPTARLVAGVNFAGLTRDPEFLKDYMADPLNVTENLTTLMAVQVGLGMKQLQGSTQIEDPNSTFCKVPLLVLQGTEDKVTSVKVVEDFMGRAANKDKELKLSRGSSTVFGTNRRSNR